MARILQESLSKARIDPKLKYPRAFSGVLEAVLPYSLIRGCLRYSLEKLPQK